MIVSFSACSFLMKPVDTPFHFAESGKKAGNICRIINCTRRGNTSQGSITSKWKELGSSFGLYHPSWMPKSPAVRFMRTILGPNCLSVANS